MKRLLLLVPLAGCPHGGGGSSTPKAKAGDVYAGLFEPQRQWTYAITEEHLDGSEASHYEISCEVTATGEADGLRLSTVVCDGPFGSHESGGVAGLWSADARGVWLYETDVTADDFVLEPPPGEDLNPDLMVLPANPKAGTRQSLDPGDDSPMSEITLEQTADGWCRTERSLLEGVAWRTKQCFSDGGVVSGELADDESGLVTYTEVQ